MRNIKNKPNLFKLGQGCFLLLCAFVLTESSAHAAGTHAQGEALFNKNCKACHGIKGSGTDKGPPLVHRIYHPDHHGDVSFHWAVEKGVRAHHWNFGDMPKLEGVKPEDVDLIIQYVRSLQKAAGIY